MSMLASAKNTSENTRPRRVLLYGTAGIGKSTFAAAAPGAVALQTEDGMVGINCMSPGVLGNYDQVTNFLKELLTEEHDYSTLVVDSVGWVERFMRTWVTQRAGKEEWGDFTWGEGTKLLEAEWERFLRLIEEVNVKRRMMIVMLGHSEVVRFNDPHSESYDQYNLDLSKSVAPVTIRWADDVLFANYRNFVTKEEQGWGKTRNVAAGSSDRVIWTVGKPSHIAKNRIDNIPETIPLDWNVFMGYFTQPIS